MTEFVHVHPAVTFGFFRSGGILRITDQLPFNLGETLLVRLLSGVVGFPVYV